MYRLAVVKRSRHIGIAVLRDTTLVALVTHRAAGSRPYRVPRLLARFRRDHAIREIIAEPTSTEMPTDCAITRLSVDDAMTALLPGEHRPTRRRLLDSLRRRFPAANASVRCARRLTRDRTVALYAFALALTRATTIY